ncbi:MAG TPA: cytochrome c biogenesis CcdA family protein [Oculatellaceae cyanobacterium]|jgi:cytochrome c-type biogenesis protein
MDYFQQLFLQSLNAHSYTVLLLAFLGGIASSLLPCTVGMLPVLVGYVGGYGETSKWSVLQQILLFMLGFALVLTLLGILASLLGMAMGAIVGNYWYYVLGIVAIVMGLHLLEVIQLPLPQFVTRLPESKPGQILAPLLMGAAFGAASSPCGTPFLTGILGFISREANWVLGGFSLFAYAFGQSMLLLVVGLCTGLIKQMATFRRVGSVVNKLSAGVFIAAGFLLIAQAAGILDLFAFFP